MSGFQFTDNIESSCTGCNWGSWNFSNSCTGSYGANYVCTGNACYSYQYSVACTCIPTYASKQAACTSPAGCVRCGGYTVDNGCGLIYTCNYTVSDINYYDNPYTTCANAANPACRSNIYYESALSGVCCKF
jgi:hypothetical protein